MNWERYRQEQATLHYTAYAMELKARIERGGRQELTPYPQFIVWKYQWIENQKKKALYSPERTGELPQPILNHGERIKACKPD
jgi:hypothetical protein